MQFNIKSLLYKKYPELFERLDFENDNIFLDPLLFGFFTQNHQKMTIEQILFGYLKNQYKLNEINVYADENGIIYLPNYGYLFIGFKEVLISLKRDKTNDISLYSLGEESIPYTFKKLFFLKSAPEIEICIYSNPIYSEVLNEWLNLEIESVKITNVIPNYREKYEQTYPFIQSIEEETLKIIDDMELAFSILKKHSPSEYQKYIKSVKRIFCFNNPIMRGFVTKNVHGTSFFSIDDTCNETFFLDEIVHQCSHNVFNVITSNTKKFIKVGKNTPLKDLFLEKQNDIEVRGFYDAFHGLYTVSTGVRTLTKILREYSFKQNKEHELFGRLAIKFGRFRTGIQNINFDQVLTKEGKDIYVFLDTSCNEILQKNPDIFNIKNDFKNQPFVFSYEKFKDLNSL